MEQSALDSQIKRLMDWANSEHRICRQGVIEEYQFDPETGLISKISWAESIRRPDGEIELMSTYDICSEIQIAVSTQEIRDPFSKGRDWSSSPMAMGTFLSGIEAMPMIGAALYLPEYPHYFGSIDINRRMVNMPRGIDLVGKDYLVFGFSLCCYTQPYIAESGCIEEAKLAYQNEINRRERCNGSIYIQLLISQVNGEILKIALMCGQKLVLPI